MRAVLDVDTGSAARAGDTAMVPTVKEGNILIQRQSEHREQAHERANERYDESEIRTLCAVCRKSCRLSSLSRCVCV